MPQGLNLRRKEWVNDNRNALGALKQIYYKTILATKQHQIPPLMDADLGVQIMKRALLFYLTLVLLLQLQESERKLNRSLQEVKNVEFEIEEATSRKKVNKAWLLSVFN